MSTVEIPIGYVPMSSLQRVPLDAPAAAAEPSRLEEAIANFDGLDVEALRPVGDRVFVRREQPDGRSAGGLLFLPEAHRDMKLFARVVAVGPGRLHAGELRPLDVKKGDRVILNNVVRVRGRFAHPDGEIQAVVESEILAVVEDE